VTRRELVQTRRELTGTRRELTGARRELARTGTDAVRVFVNSLKQTRETVEETGTRDVALFWEACTIYAASVVAYKLCLNVTVFSPRITAMSSVRRRTPRCIITGAASIYFPSL